MEEFFVGFCLFVLREIINLTCRYSQQDFPKLEIMLEKVGGLFVF